jgi:enterochelin esterase-like enzyme
MKSKKSFGGPFLFYVALFFLLITNFSCQEAAESRLKFEISFSASDHSEPITGRVFVIISKNEEREPRLQAGSWSRSVPFFGLDVEDFKPGEVAVIDEDVLGYPPKSLLEIPEGNYFVQGLVNIYTQFNRSDGHVIWAHMDQWEGQQFNRSPGNLYSEVQSVHLDPEQGYTVKLSLDKVIPPVEVPPDTDWVKHVKIQSKLLTEFWGHPIHIGAIVLLPKGYEEHPDVSYPVHYQQGHFSLRSPDGFRTEPPEDGDRWGRSGYEFYKAWNSEDFPRMFVVTIQHPCSYFDDSYAVNSANCGPFGDAIITELIPYLEENFRMIPRPYARVLSGGSTGGWESLALQVFYPDFFGGTWPHFPDPIDFRYYILTNIYEDDNAFEKDFGWLTLERPFMRDVHGQVQVTMRQLSQMEAVLGSKGRSGQQLDIWQAVYGPVGDDGYPKDIWDKLTGTIDHEVAEYFKENYDLVHILKRDWAILGPKLKGKLHIYCGDMDHFYLNEAVYELEEFLESTKDPYYEGTFGYGRPRKGHGWSPFDRATGELERAMARHITQNAPRGENISQWKYK